MSKASQIEGKVARMGEAAFERLCARILPRLGYPVVEPWGKVLGEDKTNPNPVDGWFLLPKDCYGFMQCTTEKPKGLLAKLKADFDKGLSKKLTGIDRQRVGEIVLCHSHKLSPNVDAQLRQHAKKRRCRLKIIGTSTLVPELCNSSVDIAADELGVSIGTQQVLSLDSFKHHASGGKYATSFETQFRFRDKEIEAAIAALSTHRVVMLRGKPGVGKSRLGLEVLRRLYADQSVTKALCIVDKNLDVYDDLQSLCSEAGTYLLLVDDANLFRQDRLKHVLRLLADARPDRGFRIVLTVRGYAEKETARIVGEFSTMNVVDVEPLTDEQIAEFLKDEYGIRNHRFIERISRQVDGNLRLASMIGEVVRVRKDLESIRSVEDIYRSYFDSRLGDELSRVVQPQTLKVAAMFSLLRTMDLRDEKLMERVLGLTGLSPEEFQEGAGRLHQVEVLDMMPDGKVARIADEVLGTYLFHRAVLADDAVMDLSWLIRHFLVEHPSRVVGMLNSAFGAFDGEVLQGKVNAAARSALLAFTAELNTKAVQSYHEYFWFVDQDETLAYARSLIDALPTEATSTPPDFSDDGRQKAHWRPEALKVLDSFGLSSDHHRREALLLMVEFLRKKPGSAPEVCQAFIQTFGVDRHAPEYDYRVQRMALVELLATDPTGNDPLIKGLFFHFARQVLHLEYRHMGSGRRRNVVTLSQHRAQPSQGMLALRRATWARAFAYYRDCPNEVFELLRSYKTSFGIDRDKAVEADDVDQILKFFEDCLEPSNLEHCFFVHDMLDLWKRRKIPGLARTAQRFTNPDFDLSRLLILDRSRYADMERNGWEKRWGHDLMQHGSSLSPFRIRQTISRAVRIARISGGHWPWGINSAIGHVILGYWQEDPDDALACTLEHLKQGNVLNLPLRELHPKVVSALGTQGALEFIDAHSFRNDWIWVLECYAQASKVNKGSARSFRKRVLSSTSENLHVPATLLHRLELHDPGLTAVVTDHLLKRLGSDESVAWTFHDFFNDGRYPKADLLRAFAVEPLLLQRAYYVTANEHYIDRPREWFNELLNMDPHFLARWVGWKYERSGSLDPSDERGSFAFLWHREDAEMVLSVVLDEVEGVKAKHFGDDNYLASFLSLDGSEDAADIEHRQDQFLMRQIEEHHSNETRMGLVFDMAHDLPEKRRLELIGTLLKYMPSTDLFRSIMFNEGSGVTVGSLVPKYEGRVSFLMKLFRCCNPVNHKPYLEVIKDNLAYAKRRLESERVDDYMEAVL